MDKYRKFTAMKNSCPICGKMKCKYYGNGGGKKQKRFISKTERRLKKIELEEV